MFENLKILPTRKPNKSVEQGEWGEEVAAQYLEKEGFKVMARRVKPCRTDQRLDIDLIVERDDGDGVVFVEVKTHKTHSEYASRLWSITRDKKRRLLRACNAWLRQARWYGNYRFDVVEVYGEKGSPTPPEIDHIQNVPLFPPSHRFR